MIRHVALPGLQGSYSTIGFGCASLGSRIAPKAGLRALSAAYDAGVSWYDVAPAYGAGEAEEILGHFLKGRRTSVGLCSKVGLSPPASNALMKTVYRVARPFVSRAGSLRKYFRKMPSTRNRKDVLEAGMIKASIERSLQRLQTDYLDVFALHGGTADDLARDDILRALQDIVQTGKARAISIAGDMPAAITCVTTCPTFQVVQLADDRLQADPVSELRAVATHPVGFITHSILGVAGAKEELAACIESEPAARKQLEEAGYTGAVEVMVASLLLDRALAVNSDGIVLCSMFSSRHQQANIERASRKVDMSTIDLVRSLSMRNSARPRS